MRVCEGENLRERGDRSAATTSLSLWFFPSPELIGTNGTC